MERLSSDKKPQRTLSLSRFSLKLSPRNYPLSPRHSPKNSPKHSPTSSDLRTPRSPVSPKQVQKIKLISKGGMGVEVWKVKLDGWVCCAKIIDITYSRESEVICFQKEIEILKTLPSQNKHIIQYLGFQNTGRQIEIFTALYDGSLQEQIKDRNLHDIPFTIKEIVDIAHQIISALVVLHIRKLIHRDIKSANILYEEICEEQTTTNYILGDFGESKIISKPTKTVTGTNRWMAPEIIFTETGYSFEADMWSFGMLLYELMSLEIPYYEITHGFGAEKRIMEGKLPSLTLKQKDDYASLIDIWEACLISDPKKRLTAPGCLFRLQKLL